MNFRTCGHVINTLRSLWVNEVSPGHLVRAQGQDVHRRPSYQSLHQLSVEPLQYHLLNSLVESDHLNEEVNTMALSNSMMQRSVARVVDRVQRTSVFEKQLNHWYTTNCRSTMDWILIFFVLESSRSLMFKKFSSHIYIGLACSEMHRSLQGTIRLVFNLVIKFKLT